MLVLVLGIVVLLGAHVLTTFRETRTRLIERFGAGPYRIAYAVVSIVGFILICWGFSRYRAEGWVQVWDPPVWTRHLTITLMWFAFVALAAMGRSRPDPRLAAPSHAGRDQDLGARASPRQRRSRRHDPVRLVARLGGL